MSSSFAAMQKPGTSAYSLASLSPREVVNEVLHPGEVGVACRGHAVGPTLVVLQEFAAPVAVVEGRIGQHVVRLEIRVLIGVEGVAVRDLRINAADREVHLGEAPRG